MMKISYHVNARLKEKNKGKQLPIYGVSTGKKTRKYNSNIKRLK